MKTRTNKFYRSILAINFALFINIAIGATPPITPTAVTCPDAPVSNFIVDQGYGRVVNSDHHQELLQKALGNPGKGGLCNAKVFIVDKPFRLYRAYGKEYQKLGRWWGLSSPYVNSGFQTDADFSPMHTPIPSRIGTKAEYRTNFGVCPEWNTLDKVTSCPIKPGTLIVVGPGQSVDICTTDKDGKPVVSPEKPVAYPKSTTPIYNQVYVDNAPGYVFNPDGSQVKDLVSGYPITDPKVAQIDQINEGCQDYYPGSNPDLWK